MSTISTSSIAQRQGALKKANGVRTTRAEVRRSIIALPAADGRRELANLLVNPPDWLRNARPLEVLSWPRHLGEVAAHRMLVGAEASMSRTVGQLSARQRAFIANWLVRGGPFR